MNSEQIRIHLRAYNLVMHRLMEELNKEQERQDYLKNKYSEEWYKLAEVIIACSLDDELFDTKFKEELISQFYTECENKEEAEKNLVINSWLNGHIKINKERQGYISGIDDYKLDDTPSAMGVYYTEIITHNKFIKEQEAQMREKGIKFEKLYGRNSGKFLGWKVETSKIELADEKRTFIHQPLGKYEICDPPRKVIMVNSNTGEETVFGGDIGEYTYKPSKFTEEQKEIMNKVREKITAAEENTRNLGIEPVNKKGAKLDDSKLPLSIVIQRQFPNALKAIAECSQYGNLKYHETDKDWCNMHRVENGEERYANAMMRHFLAAGKDLKIRDEESNLPHLYHAAWNMLSLLQIIEQQNK